MGSGRMSASGSASRGPPRKKLRRREEHLGWRYLTWSCHRRVKLFAEDRIKDQFVAVLAAARERHGFRLIAWVVMPEHVHLIVIPTVGVGAGSAMPSILIGIKKTMSDRVLGEWRRECSPVLATTRTPHGDERFWQPGGGFDRNVRDGKELGREIDYIHQNPVRRGLVEKPTDWKWSSARWYAGIREGTLPIDSINFRDPGPGQAPPV